MRELIFLTKEEIFHLQQEANILRKHTGQRKGQALFNKLEELHPDLAEFVRGGGADPFYDDSRIPFFMETLEETDIEGEKFMLSSIREERNKVIVLLLILIGLIVFALKCSV